MKYRIHTRYEEMILEVVVATKQQMTIELIAYDYEKPKTIFTKRFNTFQGVEKFLIRLPLTGNYTVIEVKDKNNSKNFQVVSINKKPLIKRQNSHDIRNYEVQSFVDFAQRFSFNASYLEPNKTYQSKDGRFFIEFLPVIKSVKNDKQLKTPARISKSTGLIQVSKKEFDEYTVPMRMIILLHEFAHFYMNKNQDDESEADLNGLLIYLSLGYPRIEAYEAFLRVFIGTANEQNKKRYDIINKFITDFENRKMLIS